MPSLGQATLRRFSLVNLAGRWSSVGMRWRDIRTVTALAGAAVLVLIGVALTWVRQHGKRGR